MPSNIYVMWPFAQHITLIHILRVGSDCNLHYLETSDLPTHNRLPASFCAQALQATVRCKRRRI
jgi:hypothetical protein